MPVVDGAVVDDVEPEVPERPAVVVEVIVDVVVLLVAVPVLAAGVLVVVVVLAVPVPAGVVVVVVVDGVGVPGLEPKKLVPPWDVLEPTTVARGSLASISAAVTPPTANSAVRTAARARGARRRHT
ncbi:hypothetical protein GHK86_15765, partial [Acidimicrobiaceae bacterium USS-CC1]|nr:hypothetical protein [Acidiferrimicrobium australe]